MFCVNRNGWFHFRLRVPHDLTDVVRTSHIQLPLKTKKKRQANKLSLELRDRITPQFQRLRIERLSGCNSEQLQRLALELLPVQSRLKKSQSNQSNTKVFDLVESYIYDRSKNLDERTILVTRYVFDLFIWVVGNKPIGDISRNDCREFRDTMLQLPPRALRHSSSMSSSDVVALGLKPMNPKTVNKNIQFLSGLFNWAVSEELINDNPAKALTIALKRKASLERKAYDADTLSLILRHLDRCSQASEDYWLPLLGYFTALRIEELCQLRIKDVIEVDGVVCLQVSPEAGPLKTISAERIVPIHSHLIELGFMDYVDDLDQEESIRLWPGLKANACDSACNIAPS